MACVLLHRQHFAVLPRTVLHPAGPVQRHCEAPDEQSGNNLVRTPQQYSEVSQAGHFHVGHGRDQFLRVLAAVSRAHSVDHHRTRGRYSCTGNREVLQHFVLQPDHAVPELRHESHFIQPHVVQVPRGILPTARLSIVCRTQEVHSRSAQGHLPHHFDKPEFESEQRSQDPTRTSQATAPAGVRQQFQQQWILERWQPDKRKLQSKAIIGDFR